MYHFLEVLQPMSKVIAITGASSGFGNLTAKALAHAGHVVYAGMRDPSHGNPAAQELHAFAEKEGVDLRPVELNVLSKDSLRPGVSKIIKETGRIDVLIHNAGRMTFGPAEAFTPEQLAAEYDVNCIGTHRLNRVVLPHMREAGKGFLVWVGSSSTRGGTTPFLGPYFAAKAAMDSLAVTYAGELSLWSIGTSIIVPGAYSKGTNHFAHAGSPNDKGILAAYEKGPYRGLDQRILAAYDEGPYRGLDQRILAAYDEGPYRGLDQRILDGHIAVEPKGSDVHDVARAIVEVVSSPAGTRPFRLHVSTEADRSHLINPMADFAREQAMKDMGVGELLNVHRVTDAMER